MVKCIKISLKMTEDMHTLCKTHAKFMQNSCRSHAKFMQNLLLMLILNYKAKTTNKHAFSRNLKLKNLLT